MEWDANRNPSHTWSCLLGFFGVKSMSRGLFELYFSKGQRQTEETRASEQVWFALASKALPAYLHEVSCVQAVPGAFLSFSLWVKQTGFAACLPPHWDITVAVIPGSGVSALQLLGASGFILDTEDVMLSAACAICIHFLPETCKTKAKELLYFSVLVLLKHVFLLWF